MDEQLLPCPFCGGNPTVNSEWKTATCEDCACWMPLEIWNTRHERTCKNVSDWVEQGEFECSECRASSSLAMFRMHGAVVPTFERFRHCQNCGAKVVD